jgi:hypothetical protein
MTELEINRVLRSKYASHTPRARRKAKLKQRFGTRLGQEISRTQEKLDLLLELAADGKSCPQPESVP